MLNIVVNEDKTFGAFFCLLFKKNILLLKKDTHFAVR